MTFQEPLQNFNF